MVLGKYFTRFVAGCLLEVSHLCYLTHYRTGECKAQREDVDRSYKLWWCSGDGGRAITLFPDDRKVMRLNFF